MGFFEYPKNKKALAFLCKSGRVGLNRTKMHGAKPDTLFLFFYSLFSEEHNGGVLCKLFQRFLNNFSIKCIHLFNFSGLSLCNQNEETDIF